MKLEDCKPGVRVRVYDDAIGKYIGVIDNSDSEKVWIKLPSGKDVTWYYPQQLRKIVPKKDRPSIIFACKVGSWSVITDTTDECSIAEFKRQGNVVWLMRGVKRL